MCNKKFSLMFRPHHCRMCARTICDYCGLQRRLSQEDPDKYHCCNECDFEISNPHLKVNLKQMQEQREQMLEAVRYCIVQADNSILDLKKQVKVKKEALEDQKQDFELKKRD